MKKKKLELNKKQLDMLSLCVIYQMTKISQTPCVTSDLKNAVKKELSDLHELHNKICEVM